MNNASSPKTKLIQFMIFFSGLAALSWTVLWQLYSGLALGVSAWGAAATLAITMGGMCIGSVFAGNLIKNHDRLSVFQIYGILEILIGLSGILLPFAFKIIELLDTTLYVQNSDYKIFVHLLGITAALGIPAMCMGATTPVFKIIAQQCKTSLSVLYGLNTLGAAFGAIITAFVFIPIFGVAKASLVIGLINFCVGFYSLTIKEKISLSENSDLSAPINEIRPKYSNAKDFYIVFISGFATLVLEVIWFRSFTAAFYSTTAAFSVMLASVLLSLGLAAICIPLIKLKDIKLSALLALSGVCVLLATPIIERFDLIISFVSTSPALQFIHWFILTTFVTGPAIFFLGCALPRVLDEKKSSRDCGMLYGFNTFAAITGSVTAAWILLPSVGFARSSWLIGIILIGSSLFFFQRTEGKKIFLWLIMGIISLTTAVAGESGLGRTRLQVPAVGKDAINILDFHEGPDATISVLELAKTKERALVIDGFIATGQASGTNSKYGVQYMEWMGHLPMLMHSDPKQALVICFGTGQTSNALRKENPENLTIVDINENVFKMAHHFKSNDDVLHDPRVQHLVMDGRAYLRRTDQIFDVITLEPMPPTFAGVNGLYSKEFYEFARSKLSPDGVIAQWVPFHLVSLYHGASVAETFRAVFPNAVLWVDPASKTGILLGTKNDTAPSFGKDFPGLNRNKISRILSDEDVFKAVYADQKQLAQYGAFGNIITDDNQLLAYGKANFYTHSNMGLSGDENYDVLNKITGK